jgi:uncharacterized membrane-anchored protein YitT (DUF2179 family)
MGTGEDNHIKKLEKVQDPGSAYRRAKHYREIRVSAKGHIRSFVLILIGIACASFGLKGFLLTNQFIDGGVTGVSLLISALTVMPLYLLIICINIPFVFMGYKTLGLQFAIKTLIAITGLALVLAFVEFPNVTNDNLLVAVFGGFFIGAGIGFTIRGVGDLSQ